MTNEELDKARGQEAVNRIGKLPSWNNRDMAVLAASLAREGWTPVDPDLADARQIAGDYVRDRLEDYTGAFEHECRSGKVDQSTHVVIALAAIKRGRELERGAQ